MSSPILSSGLMMPSSSMTGASGLNATGNQSGGKLPKGFRQATVPTMTAGSRSLWESLFPALQSGGLQQGLQQQSQLAGGDFSALAPMEDFARGEFDKSISQLGSRYGGAGMGPYGRLGSSGFQNAAAGQGADLSKYLMAQRLGLQQQAQGGLQELFKTLIGNQPEENVLVQKQPSFLKQLALAGTEAAGNIGAAYAGKGG